MIKSRSNKNKIMNSAQIPKRIRRMKLEDVSFVTSLANQTKELWVDERVKFPITEKELTAWIKGHSKDELLVLEVKKGEEWVKVGFCITKIDGFFASIIAFALIPEERGKGYGSFFFETLLRRLRERGIKKFMLHVHSDNIRAQKFYKKFGFRRAKEVIPMYCGHW